MTLLSRNSAAMLDCVNKTAHLKSLTHCDTAESRCVNTLFS